MAQRSVALLMVGGFRHARGATAATLMARQPASGQPRQPAAVELRSIGIYGRAWRERIGVRLTLIGLRVFRGHCRQSSSP
jgi:hypothetical protein